MKKWNTLERAKSIAMGANTAFYILKTESGYALGIPGGNHLWPEDFEYVVGQVNAFGEWRSYRYDVA